MTSGLTDTPDGPAAAIVPAHSRPPGTAAAVTTAILLATSARPDGGPAALVPWEDQTVLQRLADQVVGLGISSVLVIARPAWTEDVERALASLGPAVEVQASEGLAGDLRIVARRAGSAVDPLLVVNGDIVVHREALAGLTGNPRGNTAILAGGRSRPMAFRVHMRRGHMLGAASPYHTVRRPNASFLGVLKVARRDLERLADAAERLAELAEPLPEAWRRELERKAERWRRGGGAPEGDMAMDDAAAPEDFDELIDDPPEAMEAGVELTPASESRLRDRLAAAPDDAAALLLVGLVRGGAGVRTSYLRGLFWARPLSPAVAGRLSEQIKDFDEDRMLLDAAVKSSDGFFTTFFVSPYSKFIARWAARRGLTPNQVTTASMLIGVLAAAAFAAGERWGLVAGAVLLQVAFVTDCVDGQLARYTRQFSTLGAWLDSVFDRAKEYLVFAGLAIGASRTGDPVWLLACSALTLQTVRHMSDFSYMTVREQRLSATPQPSLEQPLDSAGLAAERRRQAPPGGTPAPGPRPRTRVDRLLSAWHRLDGTRAVRWLKRMIAFPIGERFALISVTAALFSPRVTFVAVLTWGGIAFAYTHIGRLLRTVR